MQTIALSYRRDDSQAITGRLFDRLSAHFGRGRVFRDIDSISPGSDFRVQVEDALKQCGVLIAVMGKAWRGSSRAGRARIFDETDPVRIEIEIALRQGVPIIPVLVGPTRMPTVSQVPESIQGFLFRHGCRIDPGEDFDHHADRLIRQIELSVGGPAREAAPAPRSAEQAEEQDRPYAFEVEAPSSPRERAPAHWGGYARRSLSHYPGTYLVIRPAFGKPGNLYSYLLEITWDDAGGGLVFVEKSRADARHTQTGRIWIPNPSNHLFLVSGQDGWLRSLTLSLLDRNDMMRGIVSTLHNIGGAHYMPVAAPIVLVKRDDLSRDRFGEIMPDDPHHAGYHDLVRRAVADGEAKIVSIA